MKLGILVAFLLSAFSFVKAQDTIREVYPPKHLYLPLSFGFSDHATFGVRYAGELGEYIEKNPNADIYRSFRFTANYTVIRQDEHAVDFGLNFDFYGYKIGSYVQNYKVIPAYPGFETQSETIDLEVPADVIFSGQRFSPYLEYNYAFRQDKRKKQSAGIQFNYGFYAEANSLAESSASTQTYNYPNLNGTNHPNFYIFQTTIPSDFVSATTTRRYGGFGLQLHYDFMYVHTNFDDLRLRVYYSTSFPKSTNALKGYHKLGIGLFIHIGKHFPTLDKF